MQCAWTLSSIPFNTSLLYTLGTLSGCFESSSESSFQPLKSNKSLLSNATPAKGILKKATSNPQLTHLDMQERNGGGRSMALPNFTPNVVDINKYLKQQQQHHQQQRQDNGDADSELWARQSREAVDAWSTAGTVRTHNSLRDPHSPPKSLTTATPENDYMSDVASNGGGGDYRYNRSNEEDAEQKPQVVDVK